VPACAALGLGALLAAAAPAQGPPDPAPAKDAAAPGPSSVEDLVKRGNDARHAGRMREAIDWFGKARDLSPRTYEIRILLADTLRRSGQAGAAIPEYEAGQTIDQIGRAHV